MEHPDFAKHDTSSLVSVGGGVAPAPPELVKRVEAGFRKGRPSLGYGLTETNAYGPGISGDDYLAHPTSTGRATPILQIAIRDPDGNDLPVGERGEIWFKGPHIIRGYWNRPDATAEAIVDGWFRSGDLGSFDEDGYIYISDRLKDMIISGGENIYSAEVEGVIMQIPEITGVALIGVPDEKWGEVPMAVATRDDAAHLTADDVLGHLQGRLAKYKIPRAVVFVDELPRTASGKIRKADLRRAYPTLPDASEARTP
jgi:acyl-CoA synthetase (AMP-forming)/AMP-acid ligase II